MSTSLLPAVRFHPGYLLKMLCVDEALVGAAVVKYTSVQNEELSVLSFTAVASTLSKKDGEIADVTMADQKED